MDIVLIKVIHFYETEPASCYKIFFFLLGNIFVSLETELLILSRTAMSGARTVDL